MTNQSVPKVSGMELLTTPEKRVIELCAELATLMATKVIGNESSRNGDLAEMVMHIHGIQHSVMAQAAARCYPGIFRLLGEVIVQAEDVGIEPTEASANPG